MSRPAARRPRSVAAVVIAVGVGVVGVALVVWALGGSSSSPTSPNAAGSSEVPGGVPFSHPTRDEVARRAGLALPASTATFETTRLGDELDVRFEIAATDVAAFAAGSHLTLVAGQRAIPHPSPLWDQPPAGSTYAGGGSRVGRIDRRVEVVTEGARASVRIVLTDAT